MIARKKIFAAVLFVVAAATLVGVIGQFLRPAVPDPIYRGRRLSDWLGKIGSQMDGTAAAVLSAGTNSIPLLLQLMRAHDSGLKRSLIALAAKQHFVKSPFASDKDVHEEALFGFIALGRNGQSAIPDLMHIYEMDLSENARENVIASLGCMGTGAKTAIPFLVSATTNSDPELREAAIGALGDLRLQPEIVVPALIKSLADSVVQVRVDAAVSLGNFGPFANAAVPLLLKLRNSAVPAGAPPYTMEAIDEALKEIDPAAAEKAGIK